MDMIHLVPDVTPDEVSEEFHPRKAKKRELEMFNSRFREVEANECEYGTIIEGNLPSRTYEEHESGAEGIYASREDVDVDGGPWWVWHMAVETKTGKTVEKIIYLVPNVSPERIDDEFNPRDPTDSERAYIHSISPATKKWDHLGTVIDGRNLKMKEGKLFTAPTWGASSYSKLITSTMLPVGKDTWVVWRIQTTTTTDEPESWTYLQELMKKHKED